MTITVLPLPNNNGNPTNAGVGEAERGGSSACAMQHLAPRQPITCQVVRPATSNQTSRARLCAAVAGGGRGYPAVFVGRQSLLAFWSCKSDDLFYVLRCLGALLFRHISGQGLGGLGMGW